MIDPKLIVVAFGGNAVYPPTIKGTAQEQLDIMAEACEHLVPMFRAGYRVVITHGNGPVVGNILFRMALTSKALVPMPMDVCVAHSQGGIGYMLQQSLANVLARRGLRLPDEVLVYLLSRMPRDLTSLNAVLEALDRYSLATKRPVTLPLVREALERKIP